MIIYPPNGFYLIRVSFNEIKRSSGQNVRYVIHCFRAYRSWDTYKARAIDHVLLLSRGDNNEKLR